LVIYFIINSICNFGIFFFKQKGNFKKGVELFVLKLQNLSKKFGKHTAVNQLKIHNPEKRIFGILGRNGAGKTTTFRMILGILDQTRGNIRWNDKKITQKTSDYIGYLPEERGLYPKLSVKEQLVYLGKLKGMDKHTAQTELAAWLDQF